MTGTSKNSSTGKARQETSLDGAMWYAVPAHTIFNIVTYKTGKSKLWHTSHSKESIICSLLPPPFHKTCLMERREYIFAKSSQANVVMNADSYPDLHRGSRWHLLIVSRVLLTSTSRKDKNKAYFGSSVKKKKPKYYKTTIFQFLSNKYYSFHTLSFVLF
jgi:hypothetical protein